MPPARKRTESAVVVPQAGELFDAFADELLAEQNPRLLIIVAASKTDDLLLEVLRRCLLPKIANSRQQDELLEGDSPLGTFSARIKLCLRLGLIDLTFYAVLERLRAIRNVSAHSIAFDIAKSPARDHVAELQRRISGRSSYGLTKQRYFDSTPLSQLENLQCLLLTVCILLEAIREPTRPTRGSSRTQIIAAK